MRARGDFDIGDLVKVKECHFLSQIIRDCVGTVVGFGPESGSPAVEFSVKFPGSHDCLGICTTTNGLFVSPCLLERVYSPHDNDQTEEDYKYAEELGQELEEFLFGK